MPAASTNTTRPAGAGIVFAKWTVVPSKRLSSAGERPVARISTVGPWARAGAAARSAAETSEVIAALQKGNLIEAIKVYRQLYNVGLAEAKTAVENLKYRLNI